MRKPWPAWKVTLLAIVAAFAIVMIIGGVVASDDTLDPYKSGEQVGRRFGWVVLVVPLVAYIVQKVRLDSWNAKYGKSPDDPKR